MATRLRIRMYSVLAVAIAAGGCDGSGNDQTVPEEFVGTIEAVDADGGVITWRLSCGDREGLSLSTSVPGDSQFEAFSRPDRPEAGHVVVLEFAQWAEWATSVEDEWVVNSIAGQVDMVRSYGAPSDHDACASRETP